MARRVLNVAEKPSVAKAITLILSKQQHQTRRGRSPYNPVFEFKYQLDNQDVTMVFTSVTGHLMGVDFDESTRQWHSCNPVALFESTVVKTVKPEAKLLQESLEKEIRTCVELVLWLDCDREGENIAFEVVDICKRAKPNISVRRAHFSALIPRDIIRACQTLTAPNKKFSDAVDARQEIDLRIGAAFTRFQTLRLQKKFADLDNVISYGPCQFPCLGFVVERCLAIQNFVSEDFWTIQMNYQQGEHSADFHWDRYRLYDRLACLVLYELCCDNPIATVTRVEHHERKRRRPVPLATVELQKRASRFCHIDSKRCMDIAEELYQQGFISYPRTETDKFKEGTDLIKLIEMQTPSNHWGAYAQSLLDGNFLHPADGGNDDNAHPPIHPTKFADEGQLNADQRRIYDLVTRHFLACCSRDATGQQTKVFADVAGECFTTTGLMLTARNWLQVYPYERWSTNTLPMFERGTTFTPTTLQIHQGRTEPPKLMSEADLLELMNKNGIGTDATMATHIATIQERGYVTVHNRQFKASELGIALVQGYKSMGLHMAAPAIRRQMEADMMCISNGTKTKQEVLSNCLQEMKQAFELVQQNASKLDEEVARYFAPLASARNVSTSQRGLSECGDCKGRMDLKEKKQADEAKNDRGSRFLFCATCNKSHHLPPKGKLTANQHRCPICNFQVLNVLNEQTNKSHTICPYCFDNPPQQQIENAADGSNSAFRCFMCKHPQCALAGGQASGEVVRPCPLCRNGMVLRLLKSENNGGSRRYALSCKGYPQCKGSLFLTCKSAEVSNNTCSNCHNKLVKFTFDRGQVPPALAFEPEACVAGCNDLLVEAFGWNNVRIHSHGGSNGNPPGNRNSAPSFASGGRGSNNFSNSSSRQFSSSDSAGFGSGAAPRSRFGQMEDDEGGYNSSSAAAAGSWHNDSDNPSNAHANDRFGSRYANSSNAFRSSGSSGSSFGSPPAGRDFKSASSANFGGARESAWNQHDAEESPPESFDDENSGSSSSSSSWSSSKRRGGGRRGRGTSSSKRGRGAGRRKRNQSDGDQDDAPRGKRTFTCYVCNEPGHMAPQCPQKGSGSRGGSSRGRGRGGPKSSRGGGAGGGSNRGECYKCGQFGHWANVCPNGNSE